MSQSTTFGKYRLLAELGHGGMADVFLAVTTGLEGLGFTKLVVVKRLRPNLAEDPEFVAMLVDEARIAARLNHPNAVQTYEIGQVGRQYFIAMEYLDGQPMNRIATRVKKNGTAMPLAFHLSILADVLAGLHHAHELLDFDGQPLGIVHRDVTPHNVFVTYDGVVKLVDFGIAKASGRASETKQGVVKGKVVYMAPEQASGQSVDRRADIFAVGVMLWEAVTGARMWEGFDELGIMARLITRDLPGPPSSVKADVPPELDAICKKALAPRPADRYATAEEMASDITSWLTSRGERPIPKVLGGFVAKLFEDRRRETRDVIESQLADLKNAVSTFKIRAIPDSGESSGVSGERPEATAPMALQEESGDQEKTISKPTEIDHELEGTSDDSTRMVDSGPKPAPVRTMPSPAPQRSSDAVKTMPEAGRLLRPDPPASKTKTVGVIASAVVVLVGVAMAYVGLRGRSSVAQTSGSATVSSGSAAAAPPSASPSAATISIFLSSDVPETTFRIDADPPVASPYASRIRRDEAAHVIVAIAPGHEPARYELRFDTDVAWKPTLKRAGDRVGAGAPIVKGRGPAPVATPHASSSEVLASPTATATPTTRPEASRRPVDEDNPYDRKKK